jgi:hypothetical protein
MFSKLKKFFTSSNVPDEVFVPPPVAEKKPRSPRKKKVEVPVLTDAVNIEKVKATAAGEPWVNVTGVEIDLDNVGAGSFNLDFNDIFVARLVKAGYRGNTDIQIVDQWFTEICRNIALETFAQDMADPDKRTEWTNKSTPTS